MTNTSGKPAKEAKAEKSEKPVSKSPRRRAREFALQGLYQWRVGGNDEAAIEAHRPLWEPAAARAEALLRR